MAARGDLARRRKPSQRRSRDTVQAILDGAARVFAERGYAAGTTNRIARAAGVSVGSLYEYFPNKDAILVALAERDLAAMIAEVEAQLSGVREAPASLESGLRRFVDAMLAVHEREPELHRLMFSDAPHPPELHACVLAMEESLAHALEAWLRALDAPLAPADLDAAAHLVVQTVEALTHRFVHHGIHDLPRERFVDETVALVRGYLAKS